MTSIFCVTKNFKVLVNEGKKQIIERIIGKEGKDKTITLIGFIRHALIFRGEFNIIDEKGRIIELSISVYVPFDANIIKSTMDPSDTLSLKMIAADDTFHYMEKYTSEQTE